MTEIQLLLHEWGRTWILMIVREELKYVGGGRNTPYYNCLIAPSLDT